MIRLILCASLLLLSTFSYSSHIMGGSIYYDDLGNHKYRINLLLLRNCNCTSPNSCSEFDQTLYISLFDSAGVFIDTMKLFLPPSDTLNIDTSGFCLGRKLNACIERVVYSDTITLKQRAGGYYLVYQRCCRNSTLRNIQQPIGATYFTRLYDYSNGANNSSPRFNSLLFNIYVATNYFSQKYSAYTAQLDSITYHLTSVIDGANSICPNPSPNISVGCPNVPSSPPYVSVPYIAPYSSINPTNSPSDTGNLVLDSISGLLHGTPNLQGEFVLAIEARAYRMGKFINATTIDFPILVINCNPDTTSGTSQLTAENKITYTQSNDVINIEYGAMSNQVKAVSILDCLGRQLSYTSTISQQSVNFVTSGFVSGLVFIKSEFFDGQVLIHKSSIVR
jgi:hypothetical protein